MLPILLALNGVIWYGVAKAYHYDRSTGPYPENPQFDSDLDKLWDAATPYTFKHRPPIRVLDKQEDTLIQKDFEAWSEKERKRDPTLEDYLWQEGIINPEETVWCEGIPLDPANPRDIETFERIKDKALLSGIYHSKNLDEGGLEDLYKTWFMLKGCSDYGAEMLISSGVKPWNFEF